MANEPTDDTETTDGTAASRAAAVAQGDLALVAIMRDYISYGEPGMRELKKALRLRNPPPLVTIFARDLYSIITRETPVPTKTVNTELRNRWEQSVEEGTVEAADPEGDTTAPAPYNNQACYEALVDLWDYLELEATSDVTGGPPEPKSRSLKGVWDRDPKETFKGWWHKSAGITFVGGIVITIVTYLLAYNWWQGGIIHKLMLVFCLMGAIAAGAAATFLWVRRARFINPDAFAGKEPRSRRRR